MTNQIDEARAELEAAQSALEAAVCTENLDPDVMVMKSTQNRVCFDVSGRLDWTVDRRIFIQ
jgi:hypothetical protein